jgi:hypothetical protein
VRAIISILDVLNVVLGIILENMNYVIVSIVFYRDVRLVLVLKVIGVLKVIAPVKMDIFTRERLIPMIVVFATIIVGIVKTHHRYV